MTEQVTYGIAVVAGLTSFFSGCVLPLIPSYFSFITGLSLDELTQAPTTAIRKKVMLATLAFVMGFSIVFILMGASVTFFSSSIHMFKPFIRISGGLLIIIFGLHLLGILRIRWLDYDKRLHLKQKPLHFLGTFVIGMAFGAGWSPCIGPQLGTILIIASNQDTMAKGIGLLSVYSTGMAIPFILLSVFINFIIDFVRHMSKALRYINMAAGILLILIGLLLLTDKLRILYL